VLVGDVGPDTVILGELAESEELRQLMLDQNSMEPSSHDRTRLEELYFLPRFKVYGYI